MTLDDLPIPEAFNPRVPLGPNDYAQAQASFVAEVAGKLKGEGFIITDQRIFDFVGYDPKEGPQWVILHAEVGNALLDDFRGKQFYDHIDEKGPYHLSIWRTSAGQVIALAQSFDLPEGNALAGYFLLEKY